jgi:IS30 family transposase
MSQVNITYDERQVIEKFIFYRKTNNEIAVKLSRHRSSIDREISRNSTINGSYNAWYAQIIYEERKAAPRVKSVTENEEIINFVKKNLKHYSPDVISGRALFEKNPIKISTESIYSIVYKDRKNGGILWKLLPSKRKSRKTSRFNKKDDRGSLKNQVSIHDRPQGAENRSRGGHFEGDTILGKKHKSMIFTAIDRKYKSNFTHKLKERNSDGVYEAVKLMKEYYKDGFKTLTVDNGKEFACHEKIANELGIKVFFAEPGKPHQRGSNENFNCQLRRYFPKGVDFRNISWNTVRRVMNKLNNTPRKSLNYSTPFEVCGKQQVRAILI